MLKATLSAVFTIFLFQISTAQVIDNGLIQLKLYQAHNKFRERDYSKALDLYTEAYKADSKNITSIYKMGECYLALGETETALEKFKHAVELDPEGQKDLSLSLGKAYHKLGEIDKALVEFEKYKELLGPKKNKGSEVLDYITQCHYAKQYISKPLKVKIENIGEAINSTYDDYAPSISADGKTMIFTSRRPDNKGGKLDYEGDNKYFEDVFITHWNDETKAWDVAEPIKGALNTMGHDASLSISADAQHILVYRNIPTETRSGDIYQSTLSSTGKWGSPKDMLPPINSSYFESSACFSPDGNSIYFVSERKNGIGNGDIYVSTKISKNTWGEPVNLGPQINTIDDEISVFMHSDGKTLFFSSRGHSSMGGLDIFKSVFENGSWSAPVNLGYPINTVDDDLHFVLSTDNKTAYYSTILANGVGERDIYKIDMSQYPLMGPSGSSQNVSILKGMISEGGISNPVETEISIMNVETGEKIYLGRSNARGEYLITLPSNQIFEIKIEKNGFKNFSEKVRFTDDNNSTTLVKNISLEKK